MQSIFWSLFLSFIKSIKSLLRLGSSAAAILDEEQGGDLDRQSFKSIKSSEEPYQFAFKERSVTIAQSAGCKLLKIGIFAEVYLLEGMVVRKLPRSNSDEDIQPILREAAVYSILGEHPRIAECLPCSKADFVDIKYYRHGDLATFMLKEKDKVTPTLQKRWFQQIIEAVVKIHEHDVIHSDLALRQFFLDENFDVRLGDFNSAQYPEHIALGYEKASHCLPRDYEAPNTPQSDLFALGSTLYELVGHRAPYSELYQVEPDNIMMRSGDRSVIETRVLRERQIDTEIEARYRNQIFPDVTAFFGGDIILGCWNRNITSAKEALSMVPAHN